MDDLLNLFLDDDGRARDCSIAYPIPGSAGALAQMRPTQVSLLEDSRAAPLDAEPAVPDHQASQQP